MAQASVPSPIDFVRDKMISLPAPQQRRIAEYVERVARESNPSAAGRLIDPAGMAADLAADLCFEDFKENRREMWGDATGREFD